MFRIVMSSPVAVFPDEMQVCTNASVTFPVVVATQVTSRIPDVALLSVLIRLPAIVAPLACSTDLIG